MVSGVSGGYPGPSSPTCVPSHPPVIGLHHAACQATHPPRQGHRYCVPLPQAGIPGLLSHGGGLLAEREGMPRCNWEMATKPGAVAVAVAVGGCSEMELGWGGFPSPTCHECVPPPHTHPNPCIYQVLASLGVAGDGSDQHPGPQRYCSAWGYVQFPVLSLHPSPALHHQASSGTSQPCK